MHLVVVASEETIQNIVETGSQALERSRGDQIKSGMVVEKECILPNLLSHPNMALKFCSGIVIHGAFN